MKTRTPSHRHPLATPKAPHKAAPLGVETEVVVKSAKQAAAGHKAKHLTPERGNGYSSNPAGPLEPWDFGVHSHPCTTKLLDDDSKSR